MSQTSCKELIKDYCSNCTFAGIHFIADDTKHWIERWFWIVMVILSWYGSAVLIIAAWDAFLTSPISFGVETTYTEWDTKMPSVAICETSNDDKLFNVSDTDMIKTSTNGFTCFLKYGDARNVCHYDDYPSRIWTPDHLLDLEDALKDIVYFRGVCYNLVDVCYATDNPDPLCPKSNFSYYANLVRSECAQIIMNCSYNDQLFDCCEYFQPIETDMGKCYIINSIQTKNPKPYIMVSNMKQKHASIKFQVLLPSIMYTLGEDEVPSVTTLQSSTMKIQLGHKYRRHLTVRNIENDPLTVETKPEQRACRFYYENEGGLYPYYSYSACTVLCRKRAQMELCHCNDHFMLGTSAAERCNISGLSCLHSYASHLTTLKPHWATRPGLACDCLPSCDETEITIIRDVTIPDRSDRKKTNVEMLLAYLPTERFKRNVVRSRLDLVVSIGGTTGLFVGASLLSFVELIFYFTFRYIGNHWIERQKRKTKVPESEPDNENDFNIDLENVNFHNHDIKPYANSGVLDINFVYHK